MLFPILFAVAALWIVGIIVTVAHVRRAPVAVEDEYGFHVIEDVDAGKVVEFQPAPVRAH